MLRLLKMQVTQPPYATGLSQQVCVPWWAWPACNGTRSELQRLAWWVWQIDVTPLEPIHPLPEMSTLKSSW